MPLSAVRRRVVAALSAATLVGSLAVLVATPAQAAPPDYQPPPVQFGPCSSPALVAAQAQCGMVTVPLDYADPSGQKIQIAISRVQHKSPDGQYQGIMLVNPGGPGGSGLGLSRLQSRVPRGGGNDYDWIGFDPRGVGSSQPSLSCDKSYAGFNRPYYVATEDPRAESAWLRKETTYAKACANAKPQLLQHLRSTDTVADMDSIRKALNQPKINYYGFSYGTYLGTVYATLHPAQVRRMVLDGVVDPARVWEQANYDQDAAFEKNIKVFFGWVARYDNVYHLGTTESVVEQRYYEQYQKLRAQPAAGKIGSSEWNDIFLQAGYYVYGWEDIATAFSKWVNQSDASGLLALYPSPTDDNGYAVYLGVQCTDAKWSSYQQFKQKNAALYSQAPFETWANAWFNAPCTSWGAPATTPVTVNGAAAPPILLVSETLDAATPYTGALAVRNSFPQARLVEGVGGTTHAGTLQGADACEDAAVGNYLTNGTLPARASGDTSDQQCAPTPQPVPQGATSQASAARSAQAASASGSIAPQRWDAP